VALFIGIIVMLISKTSSAVIVRPPSARLNARTTM
jgi:hypothetical protein